MNSDHGAQRFAVVVDGYAMGGYFHEAFAAHGTKLIHVQSTSDLLPKLSPPDLGRYVANIPWAGELDVLNQLLPFRPFAVVPGIEPGVPVADRLGELLTVPSNGSKLSRARRNKYEMGECLRNNGLRAAAQFKSGSIDELMLWVRRHRHYPVVVKPLDSASTDGVFICRSEASVAHAAKSILDSWTIFGSQNSEVLIQSYLEGDEYIVDTVSHGGHMYVCGVWRYEKTFINSERRVYDRDILLSPQDDVVSQLADYVSGVLHSLGIDYGPAHAEVIMTPAGPTLVEVGARLNGNLHPGFHQAALGHDQAQLTALSYADPDRFLREYAGRVYHKNTEAILFNGHTQKKGVVERVNDSVLREMENLRSTFLLSPRLHRGSRVEPTTDSLKAPLRACLISHDRDQIEHDYKKLKSLQEELFVVTPD